MVPGARRDPCTEVRTPVCSSGPPTSRWVWRCPSLTGLRDPSLDRTYVDAGRGTDQIRHLTTNYLVFTRNGEGSQTPRKTEQ